MNANAIDRPNPPSLFPNGQFHGLLVSEFSDDVIDRSPLRRCIRGWSCLSDGASFITCSRWSPSPGRLSRSPSAEDMNQHRMPPTGAILIVTAMDGAIHQRRNVSLGARYGTATSARDDYYEKWKYRISSWPRFITAHFMQEFRAWHGFWIP